VDSARRRSDGPEAAQAANIIHWVKSIAIDKDQAGTAAGPSDLAVGHYKPINSNRFLNDCHEFIFHFSQLERLNWIAWPWACPTQTSRT
jgi:hypothetical protein